MGAETTGGVCRCNEVAFPFALFGLAKGQKKEAVSMARVERIYSGPKSAEEAIAVAILADRKRKLNGYRKPRQPHLLSFAFKEELDGLKQQLFGYSRF